MLYLQYNPCLISLDDILQIPPIMMHFTNWISSQQRTGHEQVMKGQIAMTARGFLQHVNEVLALVHKAEVVTCKEHLVSSKNSPESSINSLGSTL